MHLLLLACARDPTNPPRPAPTDTAATDTGTGHATTTDTGGTPAGGSLPAGGLVLDHAHLVDATGERTAALVLSGAEIWGEWPEGGPWPEGLEVIDLQGATVIPGLIDAHVHLFHSGATAWVGDTLADNLRATLAWGVTAVADVGSPTAIFGLRDRIAAGEVLGPRILTVEGSHPCETTYDRSLCTFVSPGAPEADALVAQGADGLKVALVDNGFTDAPTPRLDLADLAAIVDRGLPVFAHVAENEDALDAAAQGVAFLAHPVFAEPVEGAAADLPVGWVATTLSAFAGVVEVVGESADLDAPKWDAVPAAVRGLWRYLQVHPEELVDGWVDDNAAWAGQLRANLPVYREHGAPIVAGSDAGYWFVAHGTTLHDELAALVDAGWSPLEALTAATSAPAAALGWDDLGLIAPGMRADLVVLDGDPLQDIAQTRSIRAVLLGGAWWDRDDLLAADVLLRPGKDPATCLDDRDCTGACDRLTHTCAAACDPPYHPVNGCGPEAWCSPVDGLATTPEGACHPGDGCDWRAQDCAPASYGETCWPADLDTGACLPPGPRRQGETCDPYDPNATCATGLVCYAVDGRCHALCDPAAPDCGGGRCLELRVDGQSWYGICL